MRRSNMGGALGALLLAGAAYAWKHRDRLSQQLSSLRGQRNVDGPNDRRHQALPDYGSVEQRDFSSSSSGVNEREFGGTPM